MLIGQSYELAVDKWGKKAEIKLLPKSMWERQKL